MHGSANNQRQQTLPVSVIIPAYNAEKWIQETLESVLNQTYQDIEIIVVDDGSTDGTVAIVEQCLSGSSRAAKLIRQSNQRAAAARNRGVCAASGSWIQFLDADDLLEPSKIELQVARVASGVLPDVVYSDWRKLIWRDGIWREGDKRTPVIRCDPLVDVLSAQNFLQLGCLLIRADIVKAVGGFDAEHEPIEDVGLCVKIAIAGGTFVKAHSSGPLASYRDVPRSFSKISQRKFIDSCVKNAKLAEHHVHSSGLDAPRVVEAIVDVYYAAARCYAGLDWTRFEEIVSDIEALNPKLLPKSPRKLRILSRITGYRMAERLAVLYRRVKPFGGNLPGEGLNSGSFRICLLYPLIAISQITWKSWQAGLI
jgi:glycosyltransferase involved in cell wall biosynthesis